MGKNGDLRLRRFKLTYHRSATENPFTKSDLMKSILPSTVGKELAEVIKTGKEEDQFYGLSSKLRG